MNMQGISEETSHVCSRSKFTIRLTELKCSLCILQKSKIACLQASVGPKDNMQKSHDSRKQISLEMLLCIKEDETHFTRVEQSTGTIVMYREVKILTKLLSMRVIHQRSICGML
jgi:hypothetical protein